MVFLERKGAGERKNAGEHSLCILCFLHVCSSNLVMWAGSLPFAGVETGSTEVKIVQGNTGFSRVPANEHTSAGRLPLWENGLTLKPTPRHLL